MLEAMLMGVPTSGAGLAKEIPSSELINAADLRTLVGLTAGVTQIEEPIWFEIPYKDTLYYVAKTPVYKTLSWDSLNALTLTTGVTKTIKGKQYIVRSLQGVLTNNKQHPSNIPADSELNGTEWNELINDLLSVKLRYTSEQLGIMPGYEWTREAGSWFNSWNSTLYQCGVVRGYSSPLGANLMVKNSALAWRPVLVLVPPPLRGEIAPADFITYPDLMTAIGLTQGTLINPTTPWLKIVTSDGRTRYWPKRSILNMVSHAALETAGMTDGKIISVGGKSYRVRLPTGLTTNPGNVAGGEWLQFITALTNGTWASYTAADLGTGVGVASIDGQAVHVKEKHTNGAWACNGYPGLMGVFFANQNEVSTVCGFRPILELV